MINQLDPLVAMAALKGMMGPGKFPLFQLLNAQNQQKMIAAGTAIMTTSLSGETVLLPAHNGVALGAPATPAAPADPQQSINSSVDGITDELRQFTNKAVGQSESRIRDDIEAKHRDIVALIAGLKPPPKKTPTKKKP